jgi:hypothetical protein
MGWTAAIGRILADVSTGFQELHRRKIRGMEAPDREYKSHGSRRTLVLPEPIIEPLVKLAREHDRSTAAEIRVALREHIRRNEHADEAER